MLTGFEPDQKNQQANRPDYPSKGLAFSGHYLSLLIRRINFTLFKDLISAPLPSAYSQVG